MGSNGDHPGTGSENLAHKEWLWQPGSGPKLGREGPMMARAAMCKKISTILSCAASQSSDAPGKANGDQAELWVVREIPDDESS